MSTRNITDFETLETAFEVSFNNPLSQTLIKNTILDMVEYTKSIEVSDEDSYNKLTALYKQAREWKKHIDTKRKEATEPLRKQTSAINDKAKEFTDPLDMVIEMTNLKSSQYLKMVEAIQEAEKQKLIAAADLFDAGDDFVMPVVRCNRGEAATAITKIERRYRIVDADKIPKKYMMIDEQAVKKDIALGINEIPGIEIYEEKVTTLRTR